MSPKEQGEALLKESGTAKAFVRWEEPCRYDVTASRCDGSPAAIDVMGAISSGSRSTRLKAAGAQVLLPLLLLQLHGADLQRSISHGDGISSDTTTMRVIIWTS